MSITRHMNMKNVMYFYILDSTFCLRDLLLSLPPAVSLRDTIGLNCSYHLQGEELYTINLYKGRHEFLQYMPEMVPPLKQFHRKGINIQVKYLVFSILVVVSSTTNNAWTIENISTSIANLVDHNV